MRLFDFLVVAAFSVFAAAPAHAQKATHMRLLSSPHNSAKLGEAVTLLAEVDGLGGGAPNGSVSFLDGSAPLRPVALSPFTSGKGGLAAGLSHTCALTVTGGVKCWGANRRGQLGEGGGSRRPRYIPVDVAGLSSGVVAITAGAEHTCALTYAGTVKCWGVNYSGQLGDGTNNDKPAPSDVSGLASGVVAISAGRTHTCALTDKGAVKCWGYNYAGALGDGTTTSRNVPVDVSGLSSGAVAISAGGVHSCALTSAGAVKCWGHNGWGQLGDGTRDKRLTPVSVTKLASGVAEISAGDFHACALTTAGAVLCWGHNLYGQLGDGTRTGQYTPIAVSGLSNGAFAVAAGNYHSCALTSDGGVKCWGANGTGELGDGTTISRPTPVAVSGLSSGGVAIAASHASCAQIVNGAVKCWGYNKDGQLGDGTSITRLTPVTTRSLGTLVRARATLSTTALGSGLHELKAVYSGDVKHGGSADAVWLRVDLPVYRTEPSRSSSITTIPR